MARVGSGAASAAPDPAALPSFAPEIPGLPKAHHAREGFAALGKLRGAHRALWRVGCLSLVDSFADDVHDHSIDQSELPLFDMLSPHHRARLLREVAVGLLCEETPLPPDTPWHYAAYYAPMHFAALVQLDYEVELEGCGDCMSDDEPEEEVASVPGGQSAPAEGAASGTGGESAAPAKAAPPCIFGPGGYEQYQVEEDARNLASRAKAKHDKHTDRAREVKLTAADVDLADVPSEARRDKTLMQRVVQRGHERMLSGGSLEDPAYRRRQERVAQKYPFVFQWRRLVHAMVQERCALSLQDPRMLVLGSSAAQSYQKMWRIAIPHPMDCPDREARDWKDVYCLLYMTLHAWPGGQRSRLWGAFLFGRLDRSRDAVRYDLIASQVKKAAKAFARQWRREDSVLDVRVLAVLVERGDPIHREHWTYMTDAGQILDASEQHHSERAFQLAQMSDDAFAALVDEDWKMLYRLRTWSWARQWHALVGRDDRGYSSVDARVDAVLHLGAESRRFMFPVDENGLCAARAECSSGDLHLWGVLCEHDVVWGDCPSSWSVVDFLIGNPFGGWGGGRCDVCNAKAAAGSKLMTCSGCCVTKYCSKECQRAGWKSGHKQMCKVLKAIAATGEGHALS